MPLSPAIYRMRVEPALRESVRTSGPFVNMGGASSSHMAHMRMRGEPGAGNHTHRTKAMRMYMYVHVLVPSARDL